MISKKMKSSIGGSSLIRAMFEEGNRLAGIYGPENVFDFSLGNPNVPAPEAVKTTIKELLDTEDPVILHGYMSNAGFEDVREAIAEDINKKHGLNLTYKHVAMTVGAGGGLSVVFRTIMDPGDEVITFAPFFGPYRSYVADNGGKMVIVPTHIGTFQPDLNALEAAITPNTKALLINNPNNPTGVIYREDVIKGIADILTKKSNEYGHCIYLISDDPYRELVYDNLEVPYTLNYYKNAFVVYSYSKSLSLPGERIGYVAVHPEMEDVDDTVQCLAMAIRDIGYTNAPSLFQKVIAKCLNESVDVDFYKKNRDLLYNHLLNLGFECAKPEGAFYLFVKSMIPDDDAFCEAAKKYNILIVPGSFFGCPGYFRIAYCVSYEKIKKSLDAWTKLAEEFKK